MDSVPEFYYDIWPFRDAKSSRYPFKPYPSGVYDEKGLPKDGQVKAPRGFRVSLWSLFPLPFFIKFN
jgi:hypothetical protein